MLDEPVPPRSWCNETLKITCEQQEILEWAVRTTGKEHWLFLGRRRAQELTIQLEGLPLWAAAAIEPLALMAAICCALVCLIAAISRARARAARAKTSLPV